MLLCCGILILSVFHSAEFSAALAHHKCRLPEEKLYKLIGSENNLIFLSLQPKKSKLHNETKQAAISGHMNFGAGQDAGRGGH